MRRALRMAAIGGSVIAVGALALVLRTLNTAGMFLDVTPDFAGTCQTVSGVGAGQDIAVDRQLGLAFVASAVRRPNASDARDGLYVVAVGHPELGAMRLSGVPRDFHPRGISLYRGADGALTLMAVNRRKAGGASVDIFDVTAGFANDGTPRVVLAERASLRSSLFFAPRDVVAVAADRFYLSNAPELGTGFADVLASYCHAG